MSIEGYELEWTEQGIIFREHRDGQIFDNFSSYQKVTINLAREVISFEPHPDKRSIPDEVSDAIKKVVSRD